MTRATAIPAFGLYGEEQPFPHVVHYEAFSARAPLHDWRIGAHRHPLMAQLFVIPAGTVRAEVDDHVWHLSDDTFLFVRSSASMGFDLNRGQKGLCVPCLWG